MIFMIFERLLEIHEDNLAWIKRKIALADNEFKKSYWRGAAEIESSLFSKLKSECDGYDPTKLSHPATEADRIKFDTEFHKLDRILEYRGYELPIYSDDYGQRYFTKFNGASWSGATYDDTPEYDFCDFADKFIDEELLK